MKDNHTRFKKIKGNTPNIRQMTKVAKDPTLGIDGLFADINKIHNWHIKLIEKYGNPFEDDNSIEASYGFVNKALKCDITFFHNGHCRILTLYSFTGPKDVEEHILKVIQIFSGEISSLEQIYER